MAFPAYVSRMTEYERGWGQRPDGYLVCLDPDGANEWDKEHNNLSYVPDEYSKPSVPVAVMVEYVPYRLLKILQEKRRVWIDHKNPSIRLMDGFKWP